MVGIVREMADRALANIGCLGIIERRNCMRYIDYTEVRVDAKQLRFYSSHEVIGTAKVGC